MVLKAVFFAMCGTDSSEPCQGKDQARLLHIKLGYVQGRLKRSDSDPDVGFSVCTSNVRIKECCYQRV